MTKQIIRNGARVTLKISNGGGIRTEFIDTVLRYQDDPRWAYFAHSGSYTEEGQSLYMSACRAAKSLEDEANRRMSDGTFDDWWRDLDASGL